MHIYDNFFCGGWGGEGGHFCESCLCLEIQEQYTLEQY